MHRCSLRVFDLLATDRVAVNFDRFRYGLSSLKIGEIGSIR